MKRQNSIAMSTLFTNEAVVDKVTKESRLFQSEEKLLGKFHVKNSDEKKFAWTKNCLRNSVLPHGNGEEQQSANFS